MHGSCGTQAAFKPRRRRVTPVQKKLQRENWRAQKSAQKPSLRRRVTICAPRPFRPRPPVTGALNTRAPRAARKRAPASPAAFEFCRDEKRALWRPAPPTRRGSRRADTYSFPRSRAPAFSARGRRGRRPAKPPPARTGAWVGPSRGVRAPWLVPPARTTGWPSVSLVSRFPASLHSPAIDVLAAEAETVCRYLRGTNCCDSSPGCRATTLVPARMPCVP